MKDDRLYARFTLDFPDSPKFIGLSVEAKWAYVEMVIYSRRMLTDGFIASAVALAKWGASICLELASNDVEKPSLIEVENGYFIHDFAEHQVTKSDIEGLREKRKRAGQKGGEASAKARAKQALKQNASKSKPETETETEVVNKRSGKPDARGKGNDTPEHRATDAAYKATGKAFNFIATKAIAKWAIHDRGEPEHVVTSALIAVYKAGRPITKTTIGQHLDGLATTSQSQDPNDRIPLSYRMFN